MKLLINPSEKRFVIAENETISGILITLDTNLAKELLLASIGRNDISIATTLDGKKTDIIVPKMSLLELHAIVFANNAVLSEKTFQTARQFGLNDCFQLPFTFKTPLNLKAGEGLFIECDNKPLSVDTTTVISIETIPAIGVKQFQPHYEIIELEATKLTHDLILENNVSQVIYMGNGNEDSPYDVEEVTVKSDKLNAEFSDSLIYSQLLETVEPDQDYLGTPIKLVDSHQILNDVRLKLKFSNAILGRKIIVVRNIVTPKTLTNLVQKQQEHQQENLQTIKANSSK